MMDGNTAVHVAYAFTEVAAIYPIWTRSTSSPAEDVKYTLENRFTSLKNNFPEKAGALSQKEIADVKARYNKYKKMTDGQ